MVQKWRVAAKNCRTSYFLENGIAFFFLAFVCRFLEPNLEDRQQGARAGSKFCDFYYVDKEAPGSLLYQKVAVLRRVMYRYT